MSELAAGMAIGGLISILSFLIGFAAHLVFDSTIQVKF